MPSLFDAHRVPRDPRSFSSPDLRVRVLTGGLAALLMLGGCARQAHDPNYYDQPTGNSAADAASQARNVYNRGVISAPSQIQLDLHPEAQPSATDTPDAVSAPGAPTAPVARAAIISQPQTYLGTLPCFQQESRCTAQRVTLTLAPNGRWRARVGTLSANGQAGSERLDQGCWQAIPEQPPRILLLEGNGNVRADFVLSRGNALRVRSVNGEALSLAYNLTRQPDLDPIDGISDTTRCDN